MQVTFVGHESWVVEAGGTAIAIDPLLRDVLGHGRPVSYAIAPARAVVLERMPPLAAVVITSEHFDHLDLGSLHLLDRRIPVLVDPLLPVVCTIAIECLGFAVYRVPFGEHRQIGRMHVALYRPGRTAAGQSRDAQVLAWAERSPEEVVLAAGTSPVSAEYLDAARAGLRPAARLVIASRSRSDGVASELATLPTFSGWLDRPSGGEDACVAARQLGAARVLLGGGGIARPAVGWKRDLGDSPRAASDPEAAPAPGIEIGAASPGDSFAIPPAGRGARSGWIEPVAASGVDTPPATAAHPAALTPAPGSDGAARQMFDRVVAQLPALARELTLAPPFGAGEPQLFARSADGLGPKSVFLALLGGPSGTHQFALDVTRTLFVPARESLESMVRDYPAGIVCHARDLDAVLQSQLCAWDLAINALQAWNRHGSAETVALRFARLFGSHLRPELASRYLLDAAHMLFDDWAVQYLADEPPEASVQYAATGRDS